MTAPTASPSAPAPPVAPPPARAAAGPLTVVLNAHAGHGDGDATRDRLQALLAASGRVFELIAVQPGPRMAAAVQRAADGARARDGVLVAVGGDGTINTVASAALLAGVPLGVVAQGTFNYFARALGIPTDLDAAGAVLLGGRLREMQVGRVNGVPFLVNASLGLYPQLLEDREAFLQQAGRNQLNAILSSLWLALRGFRQLQVEAGEGGAVRTPTLFVGNNRVQLERLGLDPDLLDGLDRGQLVGLSPRPITTLQMLGLIVRGALGQLGEAERIDRFAFRRLVVRPPGRRRIKVAIDGEVLRLRTPLTIEVHPDPLRVLVPADDPPT